MQVTPKDGPNFMNVTNAKLNTSPGVDSPAARAKALLNKLNAESAQQKAPQTITTAEDTVKQAAEAQSNGTVLETSAPTEAPKAETKVSEEALSSHYATLARKEKAIRQREQQLRIKEQAIRASEEAKAAPKAPTFDPAKFVDRERLTQDPFTVLNELGLTYDQLTEMAINAPKPEQLAMSNELRALKAEIAALKGETETTKKSFLDSQEQQRVAAINNIRNEVKAAVRLDPQFEAIRATGSSEEVVSLIEKVYDQDGILLSVEDAASQVEEYLVEEALKLTKLSKIQQKLQPRATPAQAETKTTGQPQQQQLKTLTNSVSTSKQLSARERAMLAFKGELK